MGKVTKKVWILLIIVALALPIFVGCEPEPEPVDPVAVAKAAFLVELKEEADYNKDNIVIEVTGTNIVVEFNTGATDPKIQEVAQTLANTLRDMTKSGTTLKINNVTYDLHDSLSGFEAAMKLLFTEDNTEEGYEATIKYGIRTFNISGTIKVTDNRESD